MSNGTNGNGSDVDLKRDEVITGGDGTRITITPLGLIIQPVVHHMAGTVDADYKIIVTGPEFEMLKTAIARLLSPEILLGKPIHSVDGEEIFIGIR